MNNRTSLLAGISLCALAAIASTPGPLAWPGAIAPAAAQGLSVPLQVGRFALVPDQRAGVVWRIDTINGQIGWCEINKTEEGGAAQLACHPRSGPM